MNDNAAEIIHKNGKIIWYVWCTICHKKISEDDNPNDIENTGKNHTLRTGHTTIIGCMIIQVRKEK